MLKHPIFFLIFVVQVESQSPQEIKAILKCHNEIRNQIANNGAANMKKMRWSEKLENIASKKMEQFMSRADKFEEIQAWTSFKIYQFPEYSKNLSGIIEKWCANRKMEIFENKDLLNSKSDEALQMIYSKNDEVGCVLYSKRGTSMIGCEYLKLLTENMIPDYVFKRGKACENCKCSAEFSKLCVKDEEEILEPIGSSEEINSAEIIDGPRIEIDDQNSKKDRKGAPRKSINFDKGSRKIRAGKQELILPRINFDLEKSSGAPRKSINFDRESGNLPRINFEQEEDSGNSEIKPRKGSRKSINFYDEDQGSDEKIRAPKINFEKSGKPQDSEEPMKRIRTPKTPKINFENSEKPRGSEGSMTKIRTPKTPRINFENSRRSRDSEESGTPKINFENSGKPRDSEEPMKRIRTPKTPKINFGNSGKPRGSEESRTPKINFENSRRSRDSEESRTPKINFEKSGKPQDSEEPMKRIRTPKTPRINFENSGTLRDSEEPMTKIRSQNSNENQDSYEKMMKVRAQNAQRSNSETRASRIPAPDDSREAPTRIQAPPRISEEKSEEFIQEHHDLDASKTGAEIPAQVSDSETRASRIQAPDDSREAPTRIQEISDQPDSEEPPQKKWAPKSKNYVSRHFEPSTEKPPNDMKNYLKNAIKDPNYIKESAKEYAKDKLGEKIGKVVMYTAEKVPLLGEVVEFKPVNKALDAVVVKGSSLVVDKGVPAVWNGGKAVVGGVIGVAKTLPIVGGAVEVVDDKILKPGIELIENGGGAIGSVALGVFGWLQGFIKTDDK